MVIKLFIEQGLLRLIRNFIIRVLLLIIFIESFPFQFLDSNLFIKSERTSAFETQLDSIAPGYIIKQDKDGLTFDLTNRLSDDMSVQFFSFKNTDTNKAKNDKKEKMVDNDNAVWASEDVLEDGNIYEIEAHIYDASTDKTVKHINYFKFNDKNKIFNPKLQIVGDIKFGKGYISRNSQLDLTDCKELINSSKEIEIEILNADLTSTEIKKINTTAENIRIKEYKFVFFETAHIYKINKDYIIRMKFDGKVFEKLVSCVLKDNPEIHHMTYPSELRLDEYSRGVYLKSNGNLVVYTDRFKWGYDDYPNKKIKVILTSDNKSLETVQVEYPINIYYYTYEIKIPESYFGKNEPANVRVILTDKSDTKIFADMTFQISFESKSKLKLWTGMKLISAQENSTGFKINKIGLISNDEQLQIPHSWDRFPKAHYITMYGQDRETQIGGEFRFDVLKIKTEFAEMWSFKEHDVSGCNFKINYEDMRQGINTFYFKVESSNHYQDWAYAYVPFMIYSDVADIKSINVNMKNLTLNSKGGYNFSLEALDFKPKVGDKMSIIDDEGKEHFSAATNGKEFLFTGIPMISGGKYIVIYNKISSLIHFNSLDSSILFNPVIVGTDIDSQYGLEIDINEKISDLLNIDSKKNKIRILHINGNSTGNEFENIVKGINSVRLTNNLVGGTQYIAEFSNGSEIYKTTFEYAPLRLKLGSTSGTTAKLEWEYPNNYLIMDGDILNIYFKKDGFNYPAVPDAKIIHGFQDIDFDVVRTYTMKNLSPNVNYTAKLELVTAQGIKFVSESEFVTSNFKIMNENIIGLSEDGIVTTKQIDFVWDINQADIEFSQGDRIDIFLKLRSHDTFSKTPLQTITEDINRVNKVTVDLPNYNESYSIKVVYNIGGVRYSSKVLDFKFEIDGLKSEILDITDSTARLEWKYPENVQFSDNQEIVISIKRSQDVNYDNVKTLKHDDNNDLSKITSYNFENLQSDVIYLAKIRYKLGEKIVAGTTEDIIQEKEIEFKTLKFSVDSFYVDKLVGKKIKLNWETSNKKYLFSDGDKLDVYIKERNVFDYGNPIFTASENLSDIKSLEIDIPKYNVDYDIKVNYVIKGKEVNNYTVANLEIGEINIKLDEITNQSVKISWEYPLNYKIENGDKIEIECKKEGDSEVKRFSKEHSTSDDLNNFKNQVIDGLDNNQEYELRFRFIPLNVSAIEKIYKFKAVNGFQISKVDLVNVNSTIMLLNWYIYNQNNNFSSDDKVEIFVKELSNKIENQSEDLFKGDSPKIVKHGSELDKFFNYKIEGLTVGKKYLFRIKYTLKSAGDSNVNEVYQDIEGEPSFGKFDTYVLDTGATSVKLEVIYPENYEKLEGDILDIFIKRSNETSYKVTPNFSATHGKDNIDLNEISKLDVLGLAPQFEYNAKIVFWSGGGGRGTKNEKEVLFKTVDVVGISNVTVVDMMDYLVKIGIEMNPSDLILSEGDNCKIYIKKKDDENYPDKPNGEVSGDVFNNDRVIAAYFDELNVEYDVKAIVDIGGRSFEKIIDFNSKVNDLKIEVKEVNPMTAQIEWKYPNNYTLIDGESIEVYIKYKDDEKFHNDPNLKLVQSDEVTLADINLIELLSLVPNTEYDLKVKLNLLEIDFPDVIGEFKTKAFSVEDLKIRETTEDGISISWELDSEEINFIDEYDDLSIFVKDYDDEDYDFDNPVAQFSEGLNEIRSASFKIDSEIRNPEILVSYLIEDFEAFSEIKYNSIDLDVKKDESGIFISWVYPDEIEFLDGDKLDIYLKFFDDASYPKEPSFKFIHGEDGNLHDVNEVLIEEPELGRYMVKFVLITNNVSYSPIEREIDLEEGSLEDAIKLEPKGNSKDRSLLVGNGERFNLDFEKPLTISPDGLEVEKVNNFPNLLRVKNLVPEKLYRQIFIKGTSLSSEEETLYLDKIKIRAENLLQEFLVNIYKFAFERFPDESGYAFWLSKLIEKSDVTGKYVVYNLMFAEKEFSDRNLPDDELIKVLYQIVVNREYDEGGLQYWVKEYNETYLPQANNDKFEAQKAIVMRMLYEQEFQNLCNSMDILW